MAGRQSDIDELRQIEAILSIGATSVSIDGRTLNYDLAALRLRRRELQSRIEGQTHRVVRTLDLSRAF